MTTLSCNWVVSNIRIVSIYCPLIALLPVQRVICEMKPTVAADEMFPEGVGPYMDLEEAGGPSNLLMDLAANEKAVHSDFFNDFEDLFDDEDLK